MPSRARPPRPWSAALCALLLGLAPAQGRAEAVALELVLAVDCSSSVDSDEYTLQMRGLAEAFRDPNVQQAIERSGGAGIAVALLQWSGEYGQERAIDWTVLRGAADAEDFAERVASVPRLVIGGPTAIAPALTDAADWLAANGYEGERRVIDISGDGRANQGASPIFARSAALAEGLVVNGLAILNEERNLASYYAAVVVGGPGAFLLTAKDFGDFAQAIRRKIFFEISGPPVAGAPPVAAPPQLARHPPTGR